jgi:hypothetical protein
VKIAGTSGSVSKKESNSLSASSHIKLIPTIFSHLYTSTRKWEKKRTTASCRGGGVWIAAIIAC